MYTEALANCAQGARGSMRAVGELVTDLIGSSDNPAAVETLRRCAAFVKTDAGNQWASDVERAVGFAFARNVGKINVEVVDSLHGMAPR